MHAADAAAIAAGVAPGMSLSDARAVCPQLDVREADPDAADRERNRLTDWCSRFTPLVADGGTEPGGAAGLWLDITGCAHLFGGEEALLEQVQAAVSGLGFAARAALAATPGTAWALARFGDRSKPIHYLPMEADLAAALAPLPVVALRASPDQVADLARLGLKRIGELAATPRAALAHRFEADLLRRLDQALGRRAEPLSPALPEQAMSVRLAFPEPIGHADAIAAGLERLLSALRRRLEQGGLGARQLLFQAYEVNGAVSSIRVGAGRPARDPEHWMRLFRDQLDRIDPGFGLDSLRLSALTVQAFDHRQADFAEGTSVFAAMRNRFDPAVDALIDRLANRLGRRHVFRCLPHQSHWPEQAVMRRPAATWPDKPSQWPAARITAASRPLRLLHRPEAVAALSASPATPPSRLVWRRQSLEVNRAEGPERITPEWWHPEEDGKEAVRDYYRIETSNGRRLWLARAPSPTTPETRWYVHGVFD